MLIILWIFFVAIALALAAGLALSFHFTRRSNLGETHTPEEYGLRSEPVEFTARDGISLRGVYIPAGGSNRAVIILHGHDSSYDFDLYRTPDLHQAGLNLLLFDFRAHGRSEGQMKTFGYKERWDVLAAVAFLQHKGIEHIGLLGFSYGGLTAMLTTPVCPAVEAVVTDGGPGRLMNGAVGWAAERHLPGWLTRMAARLFFSMNSVRQGANAFRFEPIRWVGQISPRPILFIHGDQDLLCSDFDELYARAREPKEMWRLPEAGHCQASDLYPEEHAHRVIDFFSRHLGQGRSA